MIEAYMLVLMLQCCGPDSVVADVLDRLSDKECHERGISFVRKGESQGFMCFKRRYPAKRK